ncbi:hypothetical protein SAMN04488557_1381 [Hyphomicrobium facile]|uniref:Uncharacterized protein n=1 Tax=Hyphomicrobium facile TaxID=51670 RepID=A0A1I7N5P1_9HYPH|nr:hypothetical protein SAMN04488557_1381 [Hyphomicrobium facile]
MLIQYSNILRRAAYRPHGDAIPFAHLFSEFGETPPTTGKRLFYSARNPLT